MVQYKLLKQTVPDAYLGPCPAKWHKKGGPTRNEDWIDRGDKAEARADCRDAQIEKITKWNAVP